MKYECSYSSEMGKHLEKFVNLIFRLFANKFKCKKCKLPFSQLDKFGI